VPQPVCFFFSAHNLLEVLRLQFDRMVALSPVLNYTKTLLNSVTQKTAKRFLDVQAPFNRHPALAAICATLCWTIGRAVVSQLWASVRTTVM
jgi:hypothetical protein